MVGKVNGSGVAELTPIKGGEGWVATGKWHDRYSEAPLTRVVGKVNGNGVVELTPLIRVRGQRLVEWVLMVVMAASLIKGNNRGWRR